MSIRTVHLVRCDRCPDGEHLPMHCYSQAQARSDAKANGWTRARSSTRYDDLCPACTRRRPSDADQPCE